MSFLYISFLSLLLSVQNNIPENSIDKPMLVNNVPVQADEMMFFLENERVGVLMQLNKKTLLKNPLGQSGAEDESTIEMLKRKAIHQLVWIKVQQQLMKDHGIKKEIGFSGFLQEWNSINLEREKAVADGKIIYGTVNYTKQNYFYHTFNNDVLKLKRLLERDVLAVPEAEARQYYEHHRPDFHSAKVSFEKIMLPLSAESLLAQGIKAVLNNPAAQITVDTLDEEGMKIYGEEDLEIAKIISTQSVGVYSRPVKTEDSWVIIKPLQRFLDFNDTYERVRSDVILYLQNKAYDQMMLQKMDSAIIEIRQDSMKKVCDAFLKKQVN